MKIPLPSCLAEACKPTTNKGKLICAMHFIASCEAKAKTLMPSLAQPQQEVGISAILLYTSNAIYKDLNQLLRDEDRSGVTKYFPYLRLFMEALSELPEIPSKHIWRGLGCDLYDSYPVKKVVTWWGVSSCTSDKKVAETFMSGCSGRCTLLTIEANSARDISCMTFYPNEKECLLAPGTMLKVKSSSRKGKVTRITLEEVGRAVG